MAHSGVVKFILVAIVIFGIGVVLLNFISFDRRQIDLLARKKPETFDSRKVVPAVSNGVQADFKSGRRPGVERNRTNVIIRTYKLPNKSNFHQVGSGDYHILLLHGRKSSWEDIGTLYHLSDWGYHAFAVGMPNNGSNSLSDRATVEWLTKLIDLLRLRNLVIISRQMTLSYLSQFYKRSQKSIRGVVLIDPEDTDKDLSDDGKQIKVPALIIHEEKDTRSQSALKKLQLIPNSETLLLKNASFHDKSKEFHRVLRQFLYKIYRPIYEKSLEISHKKPNTTQFQIKRPRKLSG